MSKLSKFSQFFSTKEHLSVEALRTIRGGSNTCEPVSENPLAILSSLPSPASEAPGIVAILDDNKRPERPGGGVSTH